ncbi:ciliary microtubule inner protein 2B [Genypterus blacodes]|uniref:ciliary microtubule inner protein 2B n=1 Tax=Genypterus blacodes TaxID=154954 RepID=UPI003F76A497
MDKYPPKFSKVLVTPDPHYIPGYGGYCPQFKYNEGKTYGKLTAELLTTPEVKHSERSILSSGRLPSVEPDAETWRRNLKVIPGFTGFIPKRHNYFACTYTESCHKAQSEFDRERTERIRWDSADLPVVATYDDKQFQKPNTRLMVTTREPITKPLRSWNALVSPYIMDDSNPHKYFVSGFTGHVPKSNFLIGTSYPITTNKALVQFGKQQRHEPVTLDSPWDRGNTLPSIHRGQLPKFTGHIPGARFMYGHTFGQLSHNALEQFRVKRNLQTG